MTNFITGIIGIGGVLAFLGILLWWTKAPPLILICGAVMVLVMYDFVLSFRESSGVQAVETALGKMLLGAAICGVAVAITIATYTGTLAAPGGGYYVLAAGALVWGGWIFVANLIAMRRGQS